jgi:hypothetical protein
MFLFCSGPQGPNKRGGKRKGEEGMSETNDIPETLPALAETQGSFITPALDLEAYRPALSELSLTREREDELLQTLWSIMSAFVDLGFGLDSVQTIFNAGAGCATEEGHTASSPERPHKPEHAKEVPP